jgi:hypothetical protein
MKLVSVGITRLQKKYLLGARVAPVFAAPAAALVPSYSFAIRPSRGASFGGLRLAKTADLWAANSVRKDITEQYRSSAQPENGIIMTRLASCS